MSISTLDDLKNQVKSFLARASILDTVGVDNLDNLVLLGEKWIFRRARAPEMETDLSVNISSGVAAVPSDFVALKHARIDGSPSTPLRMRPADWIYEAYPLRSADNKPTYIGRDGSNFIFGPFPDSDYSVLGTYYARPTSILTSANTLFITNPDLYLFAVLAEATAYVKNDARVFLWQTKRNNILTDVNAEAQQGKYGGPVAMEVR